MNALLRYLVMVLLLLCAAPVVDAAERLAAPPAVAARAVTPMRLPHVGQSHVGQSHVGHRAADAAEDLAQLRAAIDSGIVMLEKKRYVAFLQRFVIPAKLADVQEERTMEEFAESFAKGKAKVLLSVLKEVRRKKPVMGEEEGVATYKLRKRRGVPGEIEFERVDGVWYIRN